MVSWTEACSFALRDWVVSEVDPEEEQDECLRVKCGFYIDFAHVGE